MREIKFRARGSSFNNWVYGLPTYLADRSVNENGNIYKECYFSSGKEGASLLKIDKTTISQYTGLKDKNGVEIFEGDMNQDKGVVVWNKDSASFCWDYKDIELMPFENESDWCEITGSIHETTD